MINSQRPSIPDVSAGHETRSICLTKFDEQVVTCAFNILLSNRHQTASQFRSPTKALYSVAVQLMQVGLASTTRLNITMSIRSTTVRMKLPTTMRRPFQSHVEHDANDEDLSQNLVWSRPSSSLPIIRLKTRLMATIPHHLWSLTEAGEKYRCRAVIFWKVALMPY